MGTIRDFRKETIDYMYENVDTNVDSFWDIFNDLYTGLFKGDSAIREDLSNANRYLREVMELEDITLEKLEQILDDVKVVEDDFIKKADKGMGNVRKLGRELGQFIDGLPTVRPLGLNEEWRGAGIVTINPGALSPTGGKGSVRDIPMHNMPGNRSVEAYLAVIASLGVTTLPRYQRDSDTYCNIFIWDVTKAMGCEIPHYVNLNPPYDGAYGASAADSAYGPNSLPGYGEMDANMTVAWMLAHGDTIGWKMTTDPSVAGAYANEGKPVMAGWMTQSYRDSCTWPSTDSPTSPYSHGAGHVAMVVPRNEELEQLNPGLSTGSGADGLRLAQAGWDNFEYGDLEDSFPNNEPIYYFYHE